MGVTAVDTTVTVMDSSWANNLKEEFPGLKGSASWVLCDAATGTQVHQSVVAAIAEKLSSPTANLGGTYTSALETIQGVARAREAAASFFNCLPNEVVFGANMTSITNHVARSVGKLLSEDDNIVVTNLDHDANVTPWVLVATERNASVRRIDFDLENCLLDLEALEKNVDKQTKLVAIGAAANSCGSLTPIKTAVEIVKKASDGKALVYVDAVHYAPHKLIDVQDLGCDFLTCSAYKFCGPHAGLMFGKAEQLMKLEPYKLTACSNYLPGPEYGQSSRWETGTASFEAIAGIKAAIEYMASIGVRAGIASQSDSLRKKLQSAYYAINTHESEISELFLKEVVDTPGLTVYGVTDTDQLGKRTPTFAMNMEGLKTGELAQKLTDRGIACGGGHFYAINFPKLMKLEELGGFTRIAFFHYHTLEDVMFVTKALRNIAESL